MLLSNSTDPVFANVIKLLTVSATVSVLTLRAAIRWHSRRNQNPCGREAAQKNLTENDRTNQNYPLTPKESENDATRVSKTALRAADPYDTRPRRDYLSWDDYFMAVAYLSAQRSKDPAKQVGACIVDSKNIICGIGYNGFPRGCPDDELPWSKLSEGGDPLGTKYPYVCHAEMNAILNKNGASVAGAKLYVTMFPCNECAKLLIQAGIREIVFHEDKAQPKGGTPLPGGGGFKLSQQYAASRKLLNMAGIQVRQHRFQRPFSLTLTNDVNIPSANAVYNEMVVDEIELKSTGDLLNTRMDNQNGKIEKKTLKFDDM